MPMHDWKLVAAGIFHAFHHNWISAISNTLNAGLLPPRILRLARAASRGFWAGRFDLAGPNGPARR